MSILSRLRAFIADAWDRLKADGGPDDAPLLADHVWDDVLTYVRSRGLQVIAFDHSRAAKSIAASIFADAGHAATKLTDGHDNAIAEIESAVSAALGYLAAVGIAGEDAKSSYPVAGKIGPETGGPGPERAA